MTALVRTETKATPSGEQCFVIQLAAPRSNALEPGLLAEFSRALDALEESNGRLALVQGGPNFSTGGDVKRFLEAAERGAAQAYADTVVPVLQACVLRMIRMPVLFATAARGAVTGGAAGFLFAADLAVLSPDCFVQPYYTTMGFAPDGGWTAVLPERIGAGAAQRWLMSDKRKDALALESAGLANDISDAPEDRALELFGAMSVEAALAAKALIWDKPRCAAVAARLDAETRAFRALIGQPATRARMAAFLDRRRSPARV